MTIYLGSRYEQDDIFLAPVPGDTSLRTSVVHRPWTPLVVSYEIWEFRSGDRLDLIAYKKYGDSTMWWVIADANPEIPDISNIAPGTKVRVPNG